MRQELINVLSVQSESYNSTMMESYITHQIEAMGLIAIHDKGNIYCIKGIADTYPCIVSHMDSVHKIIPDDDYHIMFDDRMAMGINLSTMKPTGCGGDDKVGIYACLRLLQEYECVKVAFFKDEEVGCDGSYDADVEFFKDVRFILQCDRRGNTDFVNEIYGTQLQNKKFKKQVAPLLRNHGYNFSSGMLTDVYALTQIGVSVSVANISCGYFNPHCDDEIVMFEDVDNCLDLCRAIFDNLEDTYPVQRQKAYKSLSKYNYNRYSYDYDDFETGWGATTPVKDTSTTDIEICEGCNEWRLTKDIEYVYKYSTYMCKDCVDIYS